MNQELIDMAREAAAMHGHTFKDVPEQATIEFIEAFAALVAAAEREACARVCEEPARKWWSIHCHSNKHAETTRKAHDDFCALQAAIRRRGKTV